MADTQSTAVAQSRCEPLVEVALLRALDEHEAAVLAQYFAREGLTQLSDLKLLSEGEWRWLSADTGIDVVKMADVMKALAEVRHEALPRKAPATTKQSKGFSFACFRCTGNDRKPTRQMAVESSGTALDSPLLKPPRSLTARELALQDDMHALDAIAARDSASYRINQEEARRQDELLEEIGVDGEPASRESSAWRAAFLSRTGLAGDAGPAERSAVRLALQHEMNELQRDMRAQDSQGSWLQTARGAFQDGWTGAFLSNYKDHRGPPADNKIHMR